MDHSIKTKQITKKKSKKSIRYYWPFLVMCIPGLAYLLINNFLPLAGLTIAFRDIDYSIGIFNSPWAGFKNFEFLFATDSAWIIFRNTVAYNAIFIVVNTVAAVTVAILLNEVRKKVMLRIYQSLVLLPYLISMVVVAYIVYAALAADTGFVNQSILKPLGIKPINWYIEPQYWPIILPLVNLWKQVGFLCVIYFASIIGISSDYFEAAILDGAGKWKQIIHITLPLIRPTIITMFLLAVGRIFYADFGLFYQVPMDSGMIYSTTNVIDTYVYRALIKIGDIGMASAAGFFQSVLGFILVMSTNLLVRRVDSENALF
ncbi:MAG: ABC transporter permease [Saccharofermentanales bacterium]|jgi:putative aldouronate transport system permease protein